MKIKGFLPFFVQRCRGILGRRWRQLELRPWWGWRLLICLIRLIRGFRRWCWLRWFVIFQWWVLRLRWLVRRFLVCFWSRLRLVLWLLLRILLFCLRFLIEFLCFWFLLLIVWFLRIKRWFRLRRHLWLWRQLGFFCCIRWFLLHIPIKNIWKMSIFLVKFDRFLNWIWKKWIKNCIYGFLGLVELIGFGLLGG